MFQAIQKEDNIEKEVDHTEIPFEPGSLAEILQAFAMQAKLTGNWVRVYDIRYATAGMPTKITNQYILFPPGAVEVLDTGELSGPAINTEKLAFPRVVAMHGIIQFEICKANK